MVWVTTSVKCYLCDPFLQTGFCNDLTHPFCYFLKPDSLKWSGPTFSKQKCKNDKQGGLRHINHTEKCLYLCSIRSFKELITKQKSEYTTFQMQIWNRFQRKFA
jgi:hypothetical protein